MQILNFLPLLATALAAQGISLQIIRSGSQFQYSGLSRSDNLIVAGSNGDKLDLVLNDDGTLFDKNSGKYATVTSSGDFTLTDTPFKGYTISENALEYSNKEEFEVTDDGKIHFGGHSGGSGIRLRVGELNSVDNALPSKTSTTAPSTTTATASSSTVDGDAISVTIIRSGSKFQYSSLSDNDNNVFAGEGDALDLVLKKDGSLFDQASGKYVTVSSSGNVTLGDTSFKGFTIEDGQLEYSNKKAFGVSSDGQLVFGSDDGEGVVLRASQTSLGTSSSSLATASASSSSFGPGDKFHLQVIRSGSQFQYASIKKVPDHPNVFSVGGDNGEDLELAFSDDKSTLVDQDNRGIQIDSKTGEFGDVPPTGRTQATSGFEIKNGYLTKDGVTFYACPAGDNRFSLTTKSCDGGDSIALSAIAV